ncbi:MAG: zinc ribbon domain-containing protein [Synergistaceae bacterium]|nr:zinc ribbon domain-containing protein [Synergistaceae bacterium]
MAGCVKCGADIPMGAAKCEYCGATVDLPKAEPAVAQGPVAQGPGATPSSPVSGAPRFKTVSMGLMVIFAPITMGLYISFWFFLRRKTFAGMSPKAGKAGAIFAALLVIHILYVLGFLGFLSSLDEELLRSINVLFYLLWGLMIYSSVIARAALADLADSRGRSGEFAGSILWAVIFNAFYLQWQINRMIDARLLDRAS